MTIDAPSDPSFHYIPAEVQQVAELAAGQLRYGCTCFLGAAVTRFKDFSNDIVLDVGR